MLLRNVLAAVAVASWATAGVRAGDSLSPAQFETLHHLIKPQAGESPWARLPWLTNLPEARRKAAAEDRPLLIWRAGGGEVLGRA